MTVASRMMVCLVVVVACQSLGGCVVQDIHDQILETNKQILETNKRLAELEAQLELIRKANELLDAGNQELGAVQARLEMMESIDTSLKRLDEHLASLRATIDNIDSTIPFLSISGDPEDVDEPVEGDAEPDGTSAPATSDDSSPDNGDTPGEPPR